MNDFWHLKTKTDEDLISIAKMIDGDPHPSHAGVAYFQEVDAELALRGYCPIYTLDYIKNEEDEESYESDDTEQSVLPQPQAT